MVNKNNCGILTISIDIEFAWGVCDKPIDPTVYQSILREREVIKRLFELFSKYDIKATWGITGHLLLVACDWENGIVHPEIARPIVYNSRQDWFFQHPKDLNDPLWYGCDIVEGIRNATPQQEVASHSFCHIPYHERSTNLNAVKSDLEMARKLHQDSGLPFQTFIFPRNIVGYRDLLAKAGICAYRSKTYRWYDSIPCQTLQRLFNFIYFLLAITPQTVKATIDEYGMVNIADSMLLLSKEGIRSLVPSRNLVNMGIAGLNRAVEREEIFHLWFHPSDFSYKTDEQLCVLEAILKYAQRLRQNGQLEILTMGDIQKRMSGVDKLISERSDIKKIRSKTIAFHDKRADYFEREYQNISEDYYATPFRYGRKKLEILLDENLHDLPKGSSLLDIGCGIGEQLRRCREMGFNVTGIEPSTEMRAIAQKNNPEVKILNGTITNLPFQDKSFDFVMAIEVLRYLHRKDIQQSYREMLRVLRPGGKLFFTMVNRYELDGFYIYDKIRSLFFYLFHCEEPVHCEFITPKQVQVDLNNLGVKDINFYGRVFAPLLIVYKINSPLGVRIARSLDSFFDSLAQKKWMIPFAGHLIVIARHPQNNPF